jgi:hypothetical protein
MKRWSGRHYLLPATLAFTCALLFCHSHPAPAQTSYPMITHATPAAVQRGQVSEIEVFGQMDFAGTYKALFEGAGLSAEILRPSTNAGARSTAPVRSVKLRVAVARDALAGVREFRLISDRAVSSIGQLVVVDEPVVQEQGVNNTAAQAQSVQLPAAICGRIEAAEDVDCFLFHAKAGVALTFEVICARLQDKIHDLQKHADPLLTILDSRGKELSSNDDYFFADPYLTFVPPADGDYVVQIRDVKYDGDPRWTYMLLATDQPRVIQVFPMVGRAGESLPVEIQGTAARVQKSAVLTLPKEPGIHFLQAPLGQGSSNPVPVFVSNLPQLRKQGAIDRLDKAMSLPVPCGVSARIDKPRGADYYCFFGAKGGALNFEIKARRFGTVWRSSLDSVMEILDSRGKVLATNDDTFGKDSRIVFTPPAEAAYYVRVQDLHHRGGETSIYYLEATQAQPDFKLHFDPDKLMVGSGSSAACYVHVERLNGFAAPVSVRVAGLPKGMHASELMIPPSMNQGVVVVTASADAKPEATVFAVSGSAGGQDAQKAATNPAVAKEEIYLPGGGRGLFNVNMPVAAVTASSDIAKVHVEPQQLVLQPGKEVQLKVRVERQPGFDKGVNLDLLLRHLGGVFGNPLPPGVTLVENKSKTLLGAGNEGVIVLKAAPDAKPIDNVPICVLANVSVNFVVKMSYASPVITLSVHP